ncbi:MAG: 5'/3'-nucleotidase SurE [Firmicutes bacterium]|nr:5'/3'-nucleotidase SurE [Bacillota bacterium]
MKERPVILITNDDGIRADGLMRLIAAALPYGEIWVIAPESQRSASSHAISLLSPIDIRPYGLGIPGVRAFTCSGTPADCVRVGSVSLMPKKPDLLLCGINRGYNCGTDIQYSGTVGAALEGVFQGFRSVAFSEGRLSSDVCEACLETVLAEVISLDPGENAIINVNFPDCPLPEFKGILRDRTVSKSMLYIDGYALRETREDGTMSFTVDGVYHEEAEEGSDLRAVLDGYISIGRVRNLG